MANEFIARKGLIALEDSQITGSLNISSTLKIPGFSDVSASLAAAVAGGDNLGNHTATQDLNMGGNAIISVGNVDGVDVSALNTSVSTNTTNITTLTAATSSYLTSVSDGTLSGSAQIATEISGAFTAASSSFSTRVTTNDAKVSYTDAAVTSVINAANVLSSSAQIAPDISGSFTAASASFSTRVTANDAKLTANTSNVRTAGALMDDELADLAAVKAINQGLTTTSNVVFNHITASGDISSSGDIAGNTITVAGTDFINFHSTGYRVNSGAGPLNLFGNITASGDISSSGDIAGNRLVIGGTQLVDLHSSGFRLGSATKGFNIFGNTLNITSNITASGDISSSSDIIGNDITSSNNILIKGGGLSIKNKGAQSYARFYCESNNAHYTEIKAQEHANFSGNVTLLLPAYDFDFASPDFGSADLAANNLSGTNTGDQDLSGLALKTAVSGAFTIDSASFSTRVTANDAKLTANASNVQTAGALMDSELAEIATVKALTAAGISGSFTAASASLAADIATNTGNIGTTTNALTVDNATLQLNTGTTFNGSAARTISIKDGGVDSDALAADIEVTTLTATKIITTQFTSSFITSSTIVTEGSNIFGDTSADTHTFNGDITASGNISSSGDMIASNLIADSASFSTRVTANDAKLTANTSNVTTAGALMDSELADLAAVKAINQGLTTTSNVTFNDVDVDGTLSIPGINDVSASLAAAIAGGDNLGNHTATQELDLDGNNIKDALHITASGDISASSDIIGKRLNIGGTQFLDLHTTGFRVGSATEDTNIFGSTLVLSPNVTASGNISSSGFISASAFVGDGSGLTGLSSAAITTYNNSGDNRILTSVNSTTVNSEANLTFDGSGLSVTGHITASGNISASGKIITSELSALGDLIIDADGADIILKDGGTEFGRFKRDSSDFIIKSATNNKDIVFRGVDDSATITALTLDMSDAGKAFFTSDISASGIESSGDIHLSTSNTQITQKLSGGATRDLIGFDGNDNAVIGNPTANKIKLEGNVTASNNISASGTITGNSIVGTLATAAQTNITSVGTLGSLTLGGDIDMDGNNINVNSGEINNAISIDASAFKMGNGSVSTPALSFTNDSNTGLYAVAVDTLGIAAGGSLNFSAGSTTNSFSKNVAISVADSDGAVLSVTNTFNSINPSEAIAIKGVGCTATGTPGSSGPQSYGGYFLAGDTNGSNPDTVALYAQGHEDGAPNSYAAIFSGSAGGVVGINTTEPTVELDIVGTLAATKTKLAKTTTDVANHNGEVVFFGGTTSMDNGKIYYYNASGGWTIANADALADSKGLLAVALGDESDNDGMLIRGMVTLDHDPGAVADVLYLSTTDGQASSTAPSSNNHVVRVLGYCLDASNGQIYFNPSNDFIVITA